MSEKLTEMQTLTLWALLGKGGVSLQKDLKPEVKKADRDVLAKAGLITVEKPGRGYRLEASDKGWAWAADHLGADLPKRSPAGSAILQAWLIRLQAFMAARGIALADVLGPHPPAQPTPDGFAALQDRIRKTYLELTASEKPAQKRRLALDEIAAELRSFEMIPTVIVRERKILSCLDDPTVRG